MGVFTGMWGAKIYQRRLAIRRAATRLLFKRKHKMEHGFDQKLLAEFVWPLASKDAVSKTADTTTII